MIFVAPFVWLDIQLLTPLQQILAYHEVRCLIDVRIVGRNKSYPDPVSIYFVFVQLCVHIGEPVIGSGPSSAELDIL